MSEHRPQNYLVRYEHDSATILVDFLSSPKHGPEDLVYARVKRLAETYRFYAIESARGDLVCAKFTLLEKFFFLEGSPSSLATDMKWLALESGISGLASIDPWWVAVLGCAVLPDQDEEPDESDDAPPPF